MSETNNNLNKVLTILENIVLFDGSEDTPGLAEWLEEHEFNSDTESSVGEGVLEQLEDIIFHSANDGYNELNDGGFLSGLTHLYNVVTSAISLSHNDKLDSHVYVLVGDVDNVLTRSLAFLVNKNPNSKVLRYVNGQYYNIGSDEPVLVSPDQLKDLGRVKVEFIGHGSDQTLGGLNAEELAAATTKLQQYMQENSLIENVNLVGCETDSPYVDKNITTKLQELLPHLSVKGYKDTIVIDSNGHKLTALPGDPNALPYTFSLDELNAKINSLGSSLTGGDLEGFSELYDSIQISKKLTTFVLQEIVKNTALINAAKNDVVSGKLTQQGFNDLVSTLYNKINSSVLSETQLDLKDFTRQNIILDSYSQYNNKKGTFILTDYIAYLSGVTVSGTPGRFLKTLHELSKSAFEIDKKTDKKNPVGMDDDLKRALAMIWQTNEGSVSIKNNIKLDGRKIVSEIERVNGANFFKGMEKIRDKILSLARDNTQEQILSLYDKYIYEGKKTTEELYRGVSTAEYNELVKLCNSGGLYKPNVILSSTSDKNFAQSMGQVVKIIGDAVFVPNRVYRSSGGDEKEYIFSRTGSFTVSKAQDGTLILTEISGAFGKLSLNELLPHQQLLDAVAPAISNIAGKYGASVHFAPQSFLLGAGDEEGICASLREAWLHTLAQDDNGVLKNSLLDEVFLRSRELVAGANSDDPVSKQLSTEIEHFIALISGVGSSGEHSSQTLSDIVHSLVTASKDTYLSLNSGNHAMALARRTVNGEIRYFFYDPNIGEISLPVKTGDDAESILKSLLGDILKTKMADGKTLADFYASVRNNGELSFEVRTVTPDGPSTELQALAEYLRSPAHSGAEENSLPVSHDDLPADLKKLQTTTPGIIQEHSFFSKMNEWRSNITESSMTLLTKINEVLTEAEGKQPEDGQKPIIDDIRLVHAADGSLTLQFDYTDRDEQKKTASINDVGDLLQKSRSSFSDFMKSSGLSEELGSFSEGVNAFFVISGFINLFRQGDVGDKLRQLPLALSGALMMTGFTDKIADTIGKELNLSTMLNETGDFIGGGSKALFKSLGNYIGESIPGLAPRVVEYLGDFMKNVPVVGAIFNSVILYSDIEALMHSTGQNKTYNEVMLGFDASGAALSTVAPFTGPATPILEAAANILQSVHSIADILEPFTNPDTSFVENLDANLPVEQGSYQIADLLTSDTSLNILSGWRYIDSKNISADDMNYKDALEQANEKYLKLISDYDQVLVLTNQDIQNITDLARKNDTNDTAERYLDCLFALQFSKILTAEDSAFLQKFTLSSTYQIKAVPDSLRNLLDFNPKDKNGDLFPELRDLGDVNVVLDDAGGYHLSYMQSVSHDTRGTDDFHPYAGDNVFGPEVFKEQFINTGIVDDVIMGTGRVYNLEWDYGQYSLNTWSGEYPSQENASANGSMTWADVSYPSPDGYHVVPYASKFQVTGNSHDNRFYSVYSSANDKYAYTVNGKGGDDELFISDSGQYIFDGGDGSDWVIASANKRNDDDYIIYDLKSSGSPVNADHVQLHNNLSIQLTNVENISGSMNNELFHGDDDDNIIITGGGVDTVWLSGGVDKYIISGNVIFYGDNVQNSENHLNQVLLKGASLQELTLDDKSITTQESGIQVTLDEQAQKQLRFILDSGQTLFCTNKQWVLAMQIDFSALSAPPQLMPDGSTLVLSGIGAVVLPHTASPLRFYLQDKNSDTSLTLQYKNDGSIDLAVLTLPCTLQSLTQQIINTYSALTDNMENVEWKTKDNVLFHMGTSYDEQHNLQRAFVIDDLGNTLLSADISLPDNVFGADVLMLNIPSPDNTGIRNIRIGQNVAPVTVIEHTTSALLTPDALRSLQWVNHTLSTPDGITINVNNPELVKQLILEYKDSAGNQLEITFMNSLMQQAIFNINQHFDEQLDMNVLYVKAESVMDDITRLEIRTKDGVSFHLAELPDSSGHVQHTVVIDDIDATLYSTEHPDAKPFFGPKSMYAGVDAVSVNITSLVQHYRAQHAEMLSVSTTMVGRMTLQYRSATDFTPASLSGLTPEHTSDGWIIRLPDGSQFEVDSYSNLNLSVNTPTGSQWKISYGTDASGTPFVEEAIDLSGHQHTGIWQGERMAWYTGDAAQKTGVQIDLSGDIQHGGEAEGDRLSGINIINGSAYNDMLSGNGENNTLYGGDGRDQLSGNGGADLLVGGAGADTYMINTGDKVVISAQDNGTANDTLLFSGVDMDDLSFRLDGDDLVVSSRDRMAVLKDWKKGDTHYSFAGTTMLDEAGFNQRVQDGLATPQRLKDLLGLYQTLEQQNKQQTIEQQKHDAPSGESVVATDMAGWTVVKGDVNHRLHDDPQSLIVSGDGGTVISEKTPEMAERTADYRLTVDMEATRTGMDGFHVHIKAGDKELGIHSDWKQNNDGSVTLTVMADGATLNGDDGQSPLTLELEEEQGHGDVIIHHVLLQKLTGAMATFDAGMSAGPGSPGPVSESGNSLLAQITV